MSRHSFSVDGVNSSSFPVLSGVPQEASWVHYTLLDIHINDLYPHLSNTVLLTILNSLKQPHLSMIVYAAPTGHFLFSKPGVKHEPPNQYKKCNALTFASKLTQHSYQYLLDDIKNTIYKSLA